MPQAEAKQVRLTVLDRAKHVGTGQRAGLLGTAGGIHGHAEAEVAEVAAACRIVPGSKDQQGFSSEYGYPA